MIHLGHQRPSPNRDRLGGPGRNRSVLHYRRTCIAKPGFPNLDYQTLDCRIWTYLTALDFESSAGIRQAKPANIGAGVLPSADWTRRRPDFLRSPVGFPLSTSPLSPSCREHCGRPTIPTAASGSAPQTRTATQPTLPASRTVFRTGAIEEKMRLMTPLPTKHGGYKTVDKLPQRAEALVRKRLLIDVL